MANFSETVLLALELVWVFFFNVREFFEHEIKKKRKGYNKYSVVKINKIQFSGIGLQLTIILIINLSIDDYTDQRLKQFSFPFLQKKDII